MRPHRPPSHHRSYLICTDTSPLGLAHRAPDDDQADPHIPITADLLAAFRTSLSAHNVALRFFCGSWADFTLPNTYDVVLTSETIYRAQSVPALLRILRGAAASQCLVAFFASISRLLAS